jgi:Mycothiol maleylpyruvate isomerase N-terminal domain
MAPPRGAAADFLVAGASMVELLGRVEVVTSWGQPSALPQMSVGALAAHLGSQVLTVHAAVTAGEGATDEHPVPLLEHYQRVAWVRGGLDDPANVTIRQGAEESAGIGHDNLVLAVESALRDLRTAFTSSLPAGLPPAVRMPWWDWSLSFEDYLVTRVMEIVVHSDDLAVSVDVEPPPLPTSVLGPVLALLVGVSLQRHGQAAVVRALSRSERAPASISAF